jgi:hypothetical protein
MRVRLGKRKVVALLVLLRDVQVIQVAEELVEAVIGWQMFVAQTFCQPMSSPQTTRMLGFF